MKNLNKIFLSFVVAIFISGYANAKTKVSLWSESAAEPAFSALNKIVADFNASQNDIEVEHTAYENTPYETTLKTAFSGGTPADIVTINGGSNMYQYAEVNGLVDITDFVNSISDRIAPGVESVYTFDGRLYGVPQGLHIGNLIWYRKDMFDAMGIDPKEMETWSGFTNVAQKFLDAGTTPIAFGNSEGWPGNHYNNHLLRRMLSTEDYINIGLRTYDPNLEVGTKFNDPAAVKAWELYKGLLDEGYFTAGYLADDFPTAAGLMLTGKAPIFSNGSWVAGMIKDQAPDAPIGVMAFPAVEGAPGKNTDLVINSVVLSITKGAVENGTVEAAKQFLDYYTSAAAVKVWSEQTQSLAPYTHDTSTWDYDPILQDISGIIASSTSSAPFLDMLEDYACNVPHTWDASQGILTGDLTPQQAGDDHEQCVVELIETKY